MDRMPRISSIVLSIVLTTIAANFCHAGNDEAADLRLRVKNTEVLRYTWTITSSSVSSGREQGNPFTRTNDLVLNMLLQLKGLPPKGEATPLSIRLQNINYTRSELVADEKRDTVVSREKVKFTVNGKVVVDSENDVGTEFVNKFLDELKILENSEAHTMVDGAGRQTQLEGDSALVETFRSGGAHTIFPLLAGKSVKPGESWQDAFDLPVIGDFKLAKPAVIRSKITFAKWETKNGRRLAQIDLVSAMEHTDLNGENPKGVLAEISHVNDIIAATCLFDPATGHFIEGTINNEVKYHIDAEQDTERFGLDVTGKSAISFVLKEK